MTDTITFNIFFCIGCKFVLNIDDAKGLADFVAAHVFKSFHTRTHVAQQNLRPSVKALLQQK